MKILLEYEYDKDFNVLYFMERAIKRLGHEVLHSDYDGKVDLIIATSPKKGFKRPDTKTFFWEIDSVRKKHNESLGEYDVLFVDSKELDAYPDGIFLPVACDLEIHRPYKHNNPVDVSQIGAYGGQAYAGYTERERLFKLLQKHGISTYHTAGVFGKDYAYEMSKGKLILNRPGLTDLSTKYFECLAVGTTVFYELGTYYDIAIPDYHYVSFKTDDEFLAKVEHCLNHEDERLEIAKRSRRLMEARHTYEHRFLEMLQYL